MPLFTFDTSYARLPPRFWARRDPTPVPSPSLLRLNVPLARELGLDADALASPEGVAVLAGNAVPEGVEPIALAYAGHQFGGFVPQLGDGRALLLGELVMPAGERRDVQLKGSGRTPFSRGGDGRAALGPVLREYIVAEAMHALGVPTARALAAVRTGAPVFRETPLPGAVLTRVASSHLRVGTFEYLAARDDADGLKLLVEHAIARHDPSAAQAEHPVRAFFDGVVARQASLVARWMLVGFVHGVMNTDNTTISGETLDYGPCAFLDVHDPRAVWSAIDTHGRYAYGHQPRIVAWNLARLAECLLPLFDDAEELAIAHAHEALARFPDRYDAAFGAGLRSKLGLGTARDGDADLGQGFLTLLAEGAADHTLAFRHLCDAAEDTAHDAPFAALFNDPAAVAPWLARWRQRLAEDDVPAAERARAMRAVNARFIPRNHLVEEALRAAHDDDLGPFEALVDVLSRPFDEQPGRERWARPPREEERVRQTVCGT